MNITNNSNATVLLEQLEGDDMIGIAVTGCGDNPQIELFYGDNYHEEWEVTPGSVYDIPATYYSDESNLHFRYLDDTFTSPFYHIIGNASGLSNIGLTKLNDTMCKITGVPTTKKTEGLLNEDDYVFTYINQSKELIAAAITDKGVDTSAEDSFGQMANNIRQINGAGSSGSTGGSGVEHEILYDITHIIARSEAQDNVPIIVKALIYPDSNRIMKVYVNNVGIGAKTFDEVIEPTICSIIVYGDLIAGTNYIRLEVPNQDIGIISISVGDMFEMPALTADECEIDGRTYKASASSVYSYHSTCMAYMPFNGTDSLGELDCWHPDSGAPQWLKLEFERPTLIKEFTMYNRTTHVECPGNIVFQGSNDDIFWNDICEFTFAETAEAGLMKTVETEVQNVYKYYRWYIASLPSSSSHAVIAKIQINEITMINENETLLQNLVG